MQVEDYRRFVVGRAAEAIATAWVARAAGGAAAVREQAVVGHCRRAVYANGTAEMYGDTRRPDFIGMEGNEDSTLNLLFFFDGRGRPTGAIVNASCPAQVMEATYQVSSDYMGEARRLLKETFGPAFGVLCQIGPAGCQSPRDLARTRDAAYWSAAGAARLGRRVAEAAVRASEPAADVQRTGLSLRHTVRDLPLPRRRVLYPDFVRARDELAALEKTMASVEAFRSFCAEMKRNEAIPNRPGPYDSKLHPFVLMRNAEAVLKRYEDQRAEPDRAIELHAIRLGDAALATSPFELFLDYGLRIQARSPAAHTVLTQLCCGSEGYLPTARAEALGGYGALVINGQVGSDGGALLVDETLADIRRLFA